MTPRSIRAAFMARHHRLSVTVAFIVPFLLFAVSLGGCGDTSTGPGQGRMQVNLTDNHGPFDQVNIVVTGVRVHRAGTDSTEGWVWISEDSASYNLLALQNGVNVTLGNVALSTGAYDQIRLHIGEGSTVVVDGVTYPLEIPSGMESGLKLMGAWSVRTNQTLELTLDFDAERSIIQTG